MRMRVTATATARYGVRLGASRRPLAVRSERRADGTQTMTAPSDDDRERVRSYLLGQGEKYSWLELWPRVVGARVALLDAVSGVSEEQAAFHPAEGDWSIAEVVHHVVGGSRGTARVIERLAEGETPPETVRTDPAREPAGASFEELRRDLAADSVNFASLASRLPEPPSLEGTHPHMFFGDLHCRAWYLFQRVHDQDHAGQIAAIQQAAGYPEA